MPIHLYVLWHSFTLKKDHIKNMFLLLAFFYKNLVWITMIIKTDMSYLVGIYRESFKAN